MEQNCHTYSKILISTLFYIICVIGLAWLVAYNLLFAFLFILNLKLFLLGLILPPTVLTSSFSFWQLIAVVQFFPFFFLPDQVEVAYLRAARAGILEKVLNFLNEDGDIHTCNAVSERQ